MQQQKQDPKEQDYDPSQVDALLEGDLPTSSVEVLKANSILPLYQRLQDVGELSNRCASAREAYQRGLAMAGCGRFDPRKIYHTLTSRSEFHNLSIEGMVQVLTNTLLKTQETICTLIPQSQEALRVARQYELELADELVAAEHLSMPVSNAIAQSDAQFRKSVSVPPRDTSSIATYRRKNIQLRQDADECRLRAHRLSSYTNRREIQLRRLEPLQQAMQATYEFLVSAKDSIQLEREYIEHNALAYVVSDHLVRHAKSYASLLSGIKEGMFRLDELPSRAKSTILTLGSALDTR